jgi:sulfonate transport system substrate-binding protein
MTSRRHQQTDRALQRPVASRGRRAWPAAAVLLALALAGCGKPQGEAQAVLKVGSQKGGDKALLLASGALDGAPYRVEWSDFPAAQHLLEALAAGAVDVGLVGDAPFLFAYAGGADIKAVHASANPQGGIATAVLLPKASPVRSVADLKGRRIATGRGSIGHYLLLRTLERAGLKPSDVTIVFLAPSDAKAAFATGAVDAWSTWAPYLPLAVRDEGARVLTDGRGLLTGYGFEAASTPSIAAKRAQLQDYLLRLGRAEIWALTHQDAYAKVLAQETGLDEEIAGKTVALNLRLPRPIDETVIAEAGEVLKRFQASGAITAKPDVKAAFDPSFKIATTP